MIIFIKFIRYQFVVFVISNQCILCKIKQLFCIELSIHIGSYISFSSMKIEEPFTRQGFPCEKLQNFHLQLLC